MDSEESGGVCRGRGRRGAIGTGGAGGLGSGTARRLSEEGGRVVVVDRDGPGARKVAEGLPGESAWVQADVAREEDVDEYLGVATRTFGITGDVRGRGPQPLVRRRRVRTVPRAAGGGVGGCAPAETLLVDGGVATGATLCPGARWARSRAGARIVAAVPVAARQSVEQLLAEVDLLFCPHVRADLYAVGIWYADFSPVSDGDVLRLLDAAGLRSTAATGAG